MNDKLIAPNGLIFLSETHEETEIEGKVADGAVSLSEDLVTNSIKITE